MSQKYNKSEFNRSVPVTNDAGYMPVYDGASSVCRYPGAGPPHAVADLCHC